MGTSWKIMEEDSGMKPSGIEPLNWRMVILDNYRLLHDLALKTQTYSLPKL
jgi:hypothetical protein